MSERYRLLTGESTVNSKEIAEFLSKDGQILLPMLELVEHAQCAVDEVGYQQLWMFKAALDEPSKDERLVKEAATG